MPLYRYLLPLLIALPGVCAAPPAHAQQPTGAPAPVAIATLLADRDADTVPDAKGQRATVRGTVTIAPNVLRRRGLHVMVEDASAGIGLFNPKLRIDLAPGDVVEATGKVAQFKGAVQLVDVRVERIGRVPLPKAVPVSVSDADGWSHMGRRVRLEGTLGELSLDSFGTVRLTADNGAATTLFIPSEATRAFEWTRYPRGTRVQATGVVSIYKPTWPYDGGFQLVVTHPRDLHVLAPAAPAWVGWLMWSAAATAGLLAALLGVFLYVQSRNKARQRELATLAAVSSALAQPDLVEEPLARHTCDVLTAYGIADAAIVYLVDSRGTWQRLAASTTDPRLESALSSIEPVSGSDAISRIDALRASVGRLGLSLLSVHPLPGASGQQGALVALARRRRRATGMQERTLLAAAKLLSMALENTRNQQRALIEQQELQQLVITDELTRLCNRRFLDEYLRVQVPLAQRRGGGLAFIAIDIDHFKRINDTWGHDAGDRVLVRVASLLREASRGSDLPVRLGGEEFLAVIAESQVEGALAFAERLRAAVETSAFDDVVEGRDLQVTVSIGVALFGMHGFTAADLMRASDEAMYVSKRGGRNRVTLATCSEVVL